MMARGCYLLAVCMLAALLARAASVGSGGGACVVSFDQSSYTVDEGNMLEVMVTVDLMCSIEDFTVNISSIDGTAVGGSDFVPVAQMLTFTDSTREIPVSVEILNDTVVEDQEVFMLALVTNDDNVTLPDSPVEVSITDNSSVTVGFNKMGYVVPEGESVDVVLNVNGGGTLERNIMVQLTVDGGATEGADYTALPASVMLTAGTTSSTVTFTAANDTLVEEEEIVQLTLESSDSAVTVGPSSSVTITDTTIATISFSELMYSVVEGNNLTFEVVFESPVTLAREVEVTVTLIEGTAMAPGDYNMLGPMMLTLTSTGGTAMVNIVDDALLEADEMFEMMLDSTDPAVSFAVDTATVTIISPVLVFQFNQSAYTVDEGDSVPVMVTWVNPQPGKVEVRVTVEAMTPSGTLDDYSISPENITLNNASNTGVVVITALSDRVTDGTKNETFTLSLESSFRLNVSQAALTISDTTVTLNVVGDIEVMEGESITLNITAVGPFVENFVVNIEADPANEVMISPTYVDFTSTTTQVSVTIGGVLDGEPEENETVTIRFTTASANVQDFDYTITVVDATVIHTDGPQSQGVEVNDSVTLTCRFEAGNPEEIVWMKDGVPLSEGGPNVAEGGFGYSSTLIIARVEFSNCGNYTCSMRNVTSPPAELGVYQLASTSDQNPTSSIGAVGVISCSIISCGQVSIVFDIDNDNATRISLNTTTADVDETLGTVETTTEATITTLGRVHEGMSQSCNVTHSGVVLREEVFNYTLENVVINVDVRAENLTLPNRTGGDSFVVGDDVVLNCSATNPPGVDRDLTIRWFRLDTEQNEEGMYIMPDSPPANTRVETGDGYVALILPDIKDNSEEETTYICKAYNRLPNDQVDEAVNVTVISGPMVQFPRNVVTVNVGENRTLECNTAGSNPMATNITITVRRPGEDNVTVDTIAGAATRLELPITGNLSQNGSVYTCTAVNEIGPTSMSFTLVVRDVPGEVDSTKIASVPLTLLVSNVTWPAPISNNAEITNYTVTVCSTATEDCVSYTTPQPHAAVLTVPTVTYNVSVNATNVVGSSTSDTTTIVGTNRGAAPIVTGFALSPAFLILEWTLFPLVSNVTDPPNDDLPAESVFFVEEYVIRFEGGVIARVAEKSYLVRIPDGQIDPADGSDDTMLPFVVEVVYSDININTTLSTTSFTSVAVPNVEEVAQINRTPLQKRNISGGFSFQWEPPAQVDNLEFIEVYNVVIEQLIEQGGRRKRQSKNGVNVNQTGTDTDFQFTGGQPFTDYNVSVDAVLNVNGDTTRVTALSPNTIRTEEGMASAPQNPVVTEIGVTTVRVGWEAPVNPNGIISSYRVRVQLKDFSGTVMQETPDGSSTSLVITGLRGLTDYMAIVWAVNGAGVGEESRPVSFRTDFGVVPPTISNNVVANFDLQQYTFTINSFSDEYGPLSHYEVYAVITDQPPDTSVILSEQTDNSYVTFAGRASSGQSQQITVGTGVVPGQLTLANGQQVNYDNRDVRLGAKYYFFVRLYSSQNITRFSDSAPVTPSVVFPTPPTTEDDPTVPIIAGVLGVLAFILVLVLVILLIFACRGRISDSYKVPHLRRLEDGEKGGIELRRRTRHFTPVLDVGDPNVFTSVGQPTTLVCEVSGTPAPTIKWSHEGKPLDDERFLVLADHSLFIQNTSLEDEGSYLVTAENSTGTTSAQIKVTVIKPTPPEHDESHPPVPVDNFTEYFARMTANEGDDLEEEYQDVEPDFAHTAFAAKLSINRNKNRYINIIPYDHSRVILALQENTPGSDYINASYIDGYRRNNQYIATQGPTTTTLADFWRMVWELDCPTIVMVTKLEEEDKRKCEQYWPSYGSTTYGNVQVTLKEAENLAEYSIRTFSITPLAGQSSAQMPVREVKQFHFLKWPDHGVPNYATALLHFRKRVHLYHPLKRGPMIVHCSAGVGRTGTFATVDYCMERMEGEGSVDIFNFVQQMRYKRNYMVQTAPQYEFIHEAINEAITCGDTSIKAPELKDWLAKLTPDSETGKTVLEDQFKRLETASPHDEEFDCTVAEVNKDKNRVNKHLPANDQRVVLSTENDQCDYICASYIDGYRQRNAFMITQGPMEDTVGDFWRMVWELKSAAIVMLTQLEENGEEMSRKYWSDTVGEAAVFGLFHVELTSEVRDLGDYCTRKIKLSPISNPQETRIVTQFHFTKWTRSSPPESAKPMIDMIDELQRVQRKSGNQPITVHCNDGLGRTGTFCTLYYVLDRVKTEQVVDVFQAVKTLRIQRTGLVDNLEQFKFVHTATMEFLNTFSDYQNFK